MEYVGKQARTAHGIGTVTEEVLERGRKSFRVAGRNFSVWVPEQSISIVAEAGGNVGFGYQDWAAPYRDDEHQELSMLGGLESTIIPGAPYEVNQKNHTTLPYNPTPQYHSDMYRRDGTILPGDQEIDAEDRLHSSDSLSGKDRANPRGPQPNPDLFVPNSDHPFADQRTSSLHEGWGVVHEAKGPFGHVKEWLDGPERAEGAPEYDWVNDPKFQGGSKPGADHVHQPIFSSQSSYRPAGLSDRYAYIPTEAAQNTPAAQFRRDPVGFIRTCGHLWTDGDLSLEKYAQYTDLLDHEAAQAGGIEHTATWADVRAKGLRLRHEGKVSVHEMDHQNIYATVEGDNGVYDVMLAKSAGTQGIDDWACSCEWGRWAFKRQMTYVGRLCSHAYAAYQTLNSEHHKGNPGRFQKASSLVDDYKAYLSTNGQAPEAASVATFLNTQGNNVDKSDVEKLYDYISKNPEESPQRDYTVPYGNDPDECYKTSADHRLDEFGGSGRPAINPYTGDDDGEFLGNPEGHGHWDKQADILRTKPQSLTPSLHDVPEGEGQKWMDVTKDERETTDPDGIMHFAYSDNLRHLHGVSEGITDFMGGGSGGGIGDSAGAGLGGGASDPASAPAAPAPATPTPGDSGEDTGIGGGNTPRPGPIYNPGIAGSEANPSLRNHVAPPSMGGPSGTLNGEDPSSTVMSSVDPHRLHHADVLQQLRDLDAPEDDLGHMKERNDRVRDLVDKAEDQGYGASQFVAAYDDEAQKTPSDGDGDFLGMSAPGFPDKGFAGVGPDPKDWFSDSAGYVKENEDPHIEKDWHTPSSDDIVKFNDSRSKPEQGPRHGYRQADNFNPGSTFSDATTGASPVMGETLNTGSDMATDNITASLHQGYAGGDDDGYFNPNNAGAADWEEGSGEPFLNDVSNAADKMTPKMPGGDDKGSPGEDEGEGGGEDAAAGEGGELADVAMLASRKAATGGFSVEAFDNGAFDVSALDAPGGGSGELRRASRLGSGPRSQVRIDPGFRQGAQRRQAEQAPPPEDFGYDGPLEKEAFLQDDSTGADIVADFHRQGAANWVMGNQTAYSTSSGNYDDFSSSPMVQAMQRTAGRKFSPEDERRLEGEFHPQGARNMPTAEDLAGTHYVM